MLDQDSLARTLLPVGTMTKPEVRAHAEARGLRTATKPDSQDTCFLPQAGGRETFLGGRIPLRRGRAVDGSGNDVGTVDAIELVTVGQRRGLGVGAASDGGAPRYAIDVDTARAVVTVGTLDDLLRTQQGVDALTWVRAPVARGETVLVQTSAHGYALAATFTGDGVAWHAAQRRVAPGQSMVLYAADNDAVLGGGLAR
jgi:tRNA-specific 2-thiouridylase